MFILNYFKNLLQKLGIIKPTYKIIFLGLDNAGKTTLLRKMKDNTIRSVAPTQFAHNEQVNINKCNFNAIDLGGHDSMRKIWKNYMTNINGIVYMVDSSDRARIQLSKKELQGVLEQTENSQVPILILGNKMDKRDAYNEDDLRFLFDLARKDSGQKGALDHNRKVEMFMCSLISGEGYQEGFKWLVKNIN